MTDVLSSHLLVAPLESNSVFMKDTEEVRVLFQLLRQVDPYTSMAWHSIWHGSEKTR